MHDITLILTLTTALTAALVLGFVTQALRLSPIVGYLLAGIAVGPFTPGFEADHGIAEQLAEVGVILLMFGVGLQFHLRELVAVKGIAVPGALVQSAVATLLGAGVGRLAGWEWPTAFVFGGAMSVASTVVLVRVLSDNHALHTRTGHVAVGWLVVEDLLTVVALVLLPMLLRPNAGAGGVAAALGIATLKIVILVALLVVVGGRVIPRVLERVAATRSRELFTLTVLVIALGIAVGSARFFGVSMALGAFLAGMIVGRSEFSLRAAAEALPMRDAFAVLFFVSVGMIFDPRTLVEAPGLVAATLAVVIVAKPLAALAIARALGYPLRIALPVAVALAQIGEFSFMLAAVARDLDAMPDRAVDALVAAAIASITLNPILYRAAQPVEAWLARRFPGEPALGTDDSDADADVDAPHRAVVVGYGPVGQTVTQLLLDNGIEPVVIELNLDTVRRLRTFDVRTVYGDASRPEILAEAEIGLARHLVLTAAAGTADAEIVRRAKELNPEIRVVARTQHVHEVPGLRDAGASDVFSGEGEVALAMTTSILGHLGATDEQIDRERARVEGIFRSG
ncbi:sodium:proton exchanger [bacterium]|nr:sodium:proton exchanger [bacterium]